MALEQLDEFFDYKNTFMEELLTDPEIVSLINENVVLEDAVKLAYKQVFPCEYVFETVEHGDTIICFDVDIQKPFDKTFLLPTMFVWIFTHKSKLRLPEGGLRTDKLCSKIATILNGSRKYGLGELDLQSVKRYAPMTDFSGKVMTFYAKDWNKKHPTSTELPSNRKRG